jgi:hypothetical protein
MVATPSILVPQGRILAVTDAGTTNSIVVPQARVFAIVNYPAESISATQARILAPSRRDSQAMQLTQARVLAVVRGRTSDPRVRSWTFTLDGHDYYVLRCGNQLTLIYDTHSEAWYNWGSGVSAIWRAYQGANWIGGSKHANLYGSNIVVGDDTTGALYFLNPEADTDDDPVDGSDTTRTFERVAQGQVLTKGYASQPCYRVELLGSIGALTDTTLTAVTLDYSDDRGANYVSAGTVDVDSGEYNARIDWRSLGSISAPGRLFRVTDYGALRRIDSLDMDDGIVE